MKKAVIGYVPALHDGYLKLFDQYSGYTFLLVTKEFLVPLVPKLAESLKRDLRAIETCRMEKILRYLYPASPVRSLESLLEIAQYDEIILVKDAVSDFILQNIKPGGKAIIKNISPRFDWSAITKIKSVEPDTEVTEEELHQIYMRQAVDVAENSTDWWRRIGVIVVCVDGTVLTAHNTHMPQPDSVNILGDPRSNLDAGQLPDICSAIHGEGSLIADAARQYGISTDNARMYVTTFPCPMCARFIGRAGISTLYYLEGYSKMDAKDILQSQGVKLVRVLLKK